MTDESTGYGTNDPPDEVSERLELVRLRKFVRRLGYVRHHMAAGDQAILEALTDDRYTRILIGLDRNG